MSFWEAFQDLSERLCPKENWCMDWIIMLNSNCNEFLGDFIIIDVAMPLGETLGNYMNKLTLCIKISLFVDFNLL